MRLLTFQIEGYRLAVPAQAVVSVGRPYSQGQVQPLDIRCGLGLKPSPDPGLPKVTCRRKKSMGEFSVDRVLDLEDCAESQIKPWPRILGGRRLFEGVAVIDGMLFFILDLEALAEMGERTER